ncbi:MAG: transcriptional regulator, family [Bryobacterales bacterium]|nr:transcriptional regulator, family [Bryobacterales bacterium]
MVLSGVGTTLREERLRRNFSLEHVSSVTRIAARYLDAIENDRPDDLPGVVFTRGFVQQYARFLAIPDEALLAQLPRVNVEAVALPVAHSKTPKPFWTQQTRRMSLTLGAAVVAAGLLAAISVVLSPAGLAQSASERVRGASVAGLDWMRAKIARPGTLDPTRTLASPTAPPATAPPESAATSIAATEPPSRMLSATVATEVAAVSAIQVLLRARATAWVQVTADGKSAFTGLLRANDSREISGNQLVKVMTGNAGALEVSLNGKPLDALGITGQVRTIRLTAEGLLPDLKIPAAAPDPL